MRLQNLLDKLEAEENRFAGREILAPVLRGQKVVTKIAGVVCKLRLDKADFQGWAVLQTHDVSNAKLVREATKREIQKYLDLLPAVRLIAIVRDENDKTLWHALSAHQGDSRFSLSKPALLFLCGENVQSFATIVARFDGGRFWFERIEARRSPVLGAYLREQMNAQTKPESLQKKGLSAEEKTAYAWLWRESEKARALSHAEREMARLQNALAHADAQLVSYIERSGVYTVTYRIGQRQLTSVVRQSDLTVMTSGICLSGLDRDFDLTSLVGVMREAETKHRFDYEDW